MVTTYIVIGAISLAIGYILGRVYSYCKNRVQCINCGSHSTYIAASVDSASIGRGTMNNADHPIRTWEAHKCKKCNETTYINMKKDITKK